MEDIRLIALADGTSMGDMIIVFKTNAPVERLKELEKQSCQIYIDGGDDENIPIWANVLSSEGYVFEYVDEHLHVTPYRSSSEWLEDEYHQITEHYLIENQPHLVSHCVC